VEKLDEFFQSYLSPCLTFVADGFNLRSSLFQSYLSPCLTNENFFVEAEGDMETFNPTLVRV